MISLLSSLLLTAAPTLTLKIEGDGYLRLLRGTQTLYARQVALTATQSGLVTSDGTLLIPRVIVPANTARVEVSLEGRISALIGGERKSLGRLVLAMFPAKTPFSAVGSFCKTSAKPSLANPGDGLTGVVRANTTSGPAKAIRKTASQSFAEIKAEVKVKAINEVDGEYVRLSDISFITGESKLVDKLRRIDLGRAPIMGSTRGLTMMHIRAIIAASGVDVRSIDVIVPAGSTVARKCQFIEASKVTVEVQAAMLKKFGFETPLDLKTRLNPVALPIGTATMDVTQIKMENTRLTATVDVAINGKIASTLSLIYETPNLVQVKTGESLRLRLVVNAAKVEVSAKAKSNAYLGQKISVETSGGVLHTGTLIGPNLVEVKI
jgi:hypothetical protein